MSLNNVSNSADTYQELYEFAVDLAWHAGRITLRYFQTHLEVDGKDDGTPVTEADRQAEAYMRRAIEARFPDDALVGEEYGDQAGRSGRTWIIDPIDGTKSFVHGVPLYGLLIGVRVDEAPAVGVMHFPALGETVAAWRGGGCYWNGRRVGVSAVDQLGQSLATSSDLFLPGEHPGFDRLMSRVRLRRTWGDCYGYALVATGRAEVMVDPIVSPWDIAAVEPVILEAGGRFTDLDGGSDLWAGHGVATNGLVHDAVLECWR